MLLLGVRQEGRARIGGDTGEGAGGAQIRAPRVAPGRARSGPGVRGGRGGKTIRFPCATVAIVRTGKETPPGKRGARGNHRLLEASQRSAAFFSSRRVSTV